MFVVMFSYMTEHRLSTCVRTYAKQGAWFYFGSVWANVRLRCTHPSFRLPMLGSFLSTLRRRILQSGAELRIGWGRMVCAGLACALATVIAVTVSLGYARPQTNGQKAGPENAPPPAFEVASLKPAAPSDRRGSMLGGPVTDGPGLFVCTNIPLRSLLLKAWAIPLYQLSGPRSIETERYDITAKIPPGTTKEDLNLMIQNLLAERLGLVVHHETNELRIYEMFIAKGGLKMKEAEQAAEARPTVPASSTPNLTGYKGGNPQLPPGRPQRDEATGRGVTRITARMQGITDVLNMMGSYCGRPVVNKTGLTGRYDYNLVFANDIAGTPDGSSDPAPTFFAAIAQQLGLRLEPARGAIDVLHVDHFNKIPADY